MGCGGAKKLILKIVREGNADKYNDQLNSVNRCYCIIMSLLYYNVVQQLNIFGLPDLRFHIL